MTPNPDILSAELTRFRLIRHRLMEEGEVIDDATAVEALRGAIDLRTAIAEAVRSALADEAAASRLRGRMDEMEARLRRLERRAGEKRDAALAAMAEAGLERLEAPGLRIDVRHAPPELLIDDESLVPDTFRVARPAWLDYQAIRLALTSGAEVPGASLAEAAPYLSVRTN